MTDKNYCSFKYSLPIVESKTIAALQNDRPVVESGNMDMAARYFI
jgi:hypothetical protein